MTARDKDRLLQLEAEKRGLGLLSFHVCNTLRRAALTLQRWHELECGTGTHHIAEDPKGSGWWWCVNSNTGNRWRTPNREKSTLRRLSDTLHPLGLFYYVQGDPRGRALYVASYPLDHTNYNNGLPI